MGLMLINPPTVLPVNLPEVCAHLRLSEIPDELPAYVMAAAEFLQRSTGLQLCTAGYVLLMDSFPRERAIRLPRPPLQMVSGITYTDPAGTERTLPQAMYTVDAAAKPGRVVLNDGQQWPAAAHNANSVRITYTAGYGDAERVPYLLGQAVKFLAGHYFENREGVSDTPSSEIPLAVQSIIDLHKFLEVV